MFKELRVCEYSVEALRINTGGAGSEDMDGMQDVDITDDEDNEED